MKSILFALVAMVFCNVGHADSGAASATAWINSSQFSNVVISNWPQLRRDPLLAAIKGGPADPNKESYSWMGKTDAVQIVAALKKLKSLNLVVVDEGSVCPAAETKAKELGVDALGSGLYRKECPTGVMTQADYNKIYPQRGHDLVGYNCFMNNDLMKESPCNYADAVNFLSLTNRYDAKTHQWIPKANQAETVINDYADKKAKYMNPNPQIAKAYLDARSAEENHGIQKDSIVPVLDNDFGAEGQH